MSAKILILEDEPKMRRLLELVLQDPGYEINSAAGGQEGIVLWQQWQPDLVISDLKMPKMDGIEVLRYRNIHFSTTPFILLTAFGTVETAVAAMKHGAYDYLTKPVDHKKLRELVARALSENSQPEDPEHSMIGSSAAMQTLRRGISMTAATESSVLITGESGTGKELAARAIHDGFCGRNAPFIRVNCPAIPKDLLESELFGHLQGAFTGAVGDRRGAFAAADGGVLFLDEIGDLPLHLQPKLLHAVEQKEITPVGGTIPKKIRVKIVAATNRNLRHMIKSNTFRRDLYYRLNTLTLHLEPLRNRPEDIAELADYFMKEFCRKNGRTPLQIDEATLAHMQAHDWPGNIRELKNYIEQGCLQAENDKFLCELIPEVTRAGEQTSDHSPGPAPAGRNFDLVGQERRLIVEALEQCYWNQTKTAEQLGVTRNTLRYRMKKYGIKRG